MQSLLPWQFFLHRDEKVLPLLRIPDVILPRIFYSMTPDTLVNLATCSSTMRKSIIAHRAIPFVVETVCSPSIHQISFLFVDDVPCKVSFTVSTQDVDWMHCPYTRHEHRVEQRRIATEHSFKRLFKWLVYLTDVFAAGVQMGTVDHSFYESLRVMFIAMRLRLRASRPNVTMIRRILEVLNCGHLNIEDFLCRWHRTRLPQLVSFHVFRSKYLENTKSVEEFLPWSDGKVEIVRFRVRRDSTTSEVIGGEIVPYYQQLVMGLTVSDGGDIIGQYVLKRAPTPELFFPIVDYVSSMFERIGIFVD